MPEQGKPSPARPIAVGALILCFVATIAIIATSVGGGSSGGGDEAEIRDSGPDITVREPKKEDPDVQTALDRGEYIVEAGDTLVTISEATGVDVETLQELNPELDPQVLNEGERIRLR